MKLKNINIINEDFKRAKNDLADAVDIVRNLKVDLTGADKQKLERVLTKLKAVDGEIPRSDFDYFKRLVMKILTLPMHIFTI